MSEDLILAGINRGLVKIDEQNDRIEYPYQGKSYVWSDPEEKVRASVFIELIMKYKYSPFKIRLEVEVPRRVPSDRADIVVFEEDGKTPFIVVETKKENISDNEVNTAIEEGFGNANSLRSKFMFFDCRQIRKAYDVANFPSTERMKNIIPDIPINYGRVPEYKYKRNDPNWDIKAVDFKTLANIFQHCHNSLWSGGKRDPATAFDEMSKILFAKLYDERTTPNKQPYKFQVGTHENEVIVGERVRLLYDQARVIDPTVFREDIVVNNEKITEVVRQTEHVSLSHTDLDSKGRAFEQFLGEVFRGKLGQYFTRRELVEFMVSFINPVESDKILDPACGSGGFLLYSIKKVVKDIKRNYSGDDSLIFRKSYDFAHYNVYGVEINEKIARVAMMDMVINEDGHTNIECNTAFEKAFTNLNIKNDNFKVILTNPPFGDKVKSEDRDKLGSNNFDYFELARGKKRENSEHLFIERCFKFLGNSGKLGIVVPDGVLSNPSDQYVRDFIFENFRVLGIVSVPAFAFRKAGSGMRTSLLFLQKDEEAKGRFDKLKELKSKVGEIKDDKDKTQKEKTQSISKIMEEFSSKYGYQIFMAIADHIGYDSTGRPDTNDLIPEILDCFRKHETKMDRKIWWTKFAELSDRLDPLYYYLGYILPKEFQKINYEAKTLDDICSKEITSGRCPLGGCERSIGTIPVLMVGNISADGTLNLDELNYVPEGFYEENKQSSVQKKDILIAKDGATTGKVAIIPEDYPFDKCMINEHIFRIRINKGVDPYYVYYFLRGNLGQMQIQREISGGAQGGITRLFVDHILIPIPPSEIQSSVSQKTNKLETKIRELRERVKELMNESNRRVMEELQH